MTNIKLRHPHAGVDLNSCLLRVPLVLLRSPVLGRLVGVRGLHGRLGPAWAMRPSGMWNVEARGAPNFCAEEWAMLPRTACAKEKRLAYTAAGCGILDGVCSLTAAQKKELRWLTQSMHVAPSSNVAHSYFYVIPRSSSTSPSPIKKARATPTNLHASNLHAGSADDTANEVKLSMQGGGSVQNHTWCTTSAGVRHMVKGPELVEVRPAGLQAQHTLTRLTPSKTTH